MTDDQTCLRAADADAPDPDTLTALVTTGTAAFEAIRISAETTLGVDAPLFAALMMAAAEAADGRDALAGALSALPGHSASLPALARAEIASLTADLAGLLQEAARQAARSGDVTAFGRAAGCACRLRELLDGESP